MNTFCTVKLAARQLPALLLAGAGLLLSTPVLAQSAAPAAPAAPATAPLTRPDLLGKWVMTWPESGRTNALVVEGVEVVPNNTNFSGQMTAGTESCPMNATLFNQVTVLLAHDPVQPSPSRIPLPAYVALKINCKANQVFIHGLGAPSRKAAIVGRAEITNVASGKTVIEPVIFSRPLN